MISDSQVVVMTRSDAAKYLERLGVNWPGRPTVETLFQIQRAHVERIPYENIDGYLEGHLISMKPSHSVSLFQPGVCAAQTPCRACDTPQGTLD
ncbi:hypothetical protein [Streptomyces sp. RP5T]|uniref:hypothetical protein n=1 Tax=Streptomyces sp. RP5T TaxID=2490848 RepID=UPI000F650196|nr:hypothetical protein [Streptomyces sp. RP5T]RRR77466.1 hypothetical protein EHS43_28285 [Streptomyces sp. RP5T]